jgi:hypothetical protein
MFLIADMLPGNRLNINNSAIPMTPVDKVLGRIGGTSFSSCFTPAPDTPRSMASLFTGQLPMNNGCDTRTKWASKFVNSQSISIFRQLQNLNYEIVAFMQEGISRLFFPSDSSENINQFSSLFESLKEVSRLEKKENLLYFLHVMDYHFVVDDLEGAASADIQGNLRIAKCIEGVLNNLGDNFFDLIIILSDHGCKLTDNSKNMWNHLNNDRTQILMFVHKKNEIGISVNNKLTSIMDLYPYICSELGIDVDSTQLKLDGEDFKVKNDDRLLIIEDYYHQKSKLQFVAEIGALPNIWGVHGKTHSYFENISGQNYVEDRRVKVEGSRFKLEEFIERCKAELVLSSSSYFTLRTQYDSISPALQPVNLTELNFHVCYSNGDKRFKRNSRKIKRAIRKLQARIAGI